MKRSNLTHASNRPHNQKNALHSTNMISSAIAFISAPGFIAQARTRIAGAGKSKKQSLI
jgi:hypothetical protein